MKIVFNGQEFDSIDAMPAEVRRAYEAALRLAEGRGVTGTAKLNIRTRIRVNGREYGSVEEMPPELRAAFERATGGQGGIPGTVAARDRRAADRRAAFGVLALLAVAGALYVPEARAFEQTFDGNALFLYGALCAAVVGAIAFPRVLPALPARRAARATFALVAVLAATLAFTAILSMTNRRLAGSPAHAERLPIVERRYHPPGTRSPAEYQLVVRRGRRTETLDVSPGLWQVAEPGGTASAQVRHGFWGYDFVVPGSLTVP